MQAAIFAVTKLGAVLPYVVPSPVTITFLDCAVMLVLAGTWCGKK